MGFLRGAGISTPPDDARQRRATSEELWERASAARGRSAALHDQNRLLVALFESLLLDFHLRATVAPPDRAGSRRLEELRDVASQYGKRAREEKETPEGMVKLLKASLAEAAPEIRVPDRDVLALEVTTLAMAGYFGG